MDYNKAIPIIRRWGNWLLIELGAALQVGFCPDIGSKPAFLQWDNCYSGFHFRLEIEGKIFYFLKFFMLFYSFLDPYKISNILKMLSNVLL